MISQCNKLQQARVCGAGAESAACLLLVFVFTILAVMDSVQLERVVAALPLDFVVSKIQDLCFLLRTTANCLVLSPALKIHRTLPWQCNLPHLCLCFQVWKLLVMLFVLFWKS